jgi:anti-anti-sigma factor
MSSNGLRSIAEKLHGWRISIRRNPNKSLELTGLRLLDSERQTDKRDRGRSDTGLQLNSMLGDMGFLFHRELLLTNPSLNFITRVMLKEDECSNNEIIPGFDDEKEKDLRITIKKNNAVKSCLDIYLAGHIDPYNFCHLNNQILKAIENGYTTIILHMAEISFLSSSAIGGTAQFFKEMEARGSKIVLIEMQQAIYERYKLVGFDRTINIKKNLEEAILFLQDQKEIH